MAWQKHFSVGSFKIYKPGGGGVLSVLMAWKTRRSQLVDGVDSRARQCASKVTKTQGCILKNNMTALSTLRVEAAHIRSQKQA